MGDGNRVPGDERRFSITGCPNDGVWDDTAPGSQDTETCSTAFNAPLTSGTATRQCSSASVWGSPSASGCTRDKCPADSGFPETVAPTTGVTVDCPAGYSGTMSRNCTTQLVNNGWSDIDVSLCVEQCPVDGVWPATDAGTREA